MQVGASTKRRLIAVRTGAVVDDRRPRQHEPVRVDSVLSVACDRRVADLCFFDVNASTEPSAARDRDVVEGDPVHRPRALSARIADRDVARGELLATTPFVAASAMTPPPPSIVHVPTLVKKFWPRVSVPGSPHTMPRPLIVYPRSLEGPALRDEHRRNGSRTGLRPSTVEIADEVPDRSPRNSLAAGRHRDGRRGRTAWVTIPRMMRAVRMRRIVSSSRGANSPLVICAPSRTIVGRGDRL